MGHLTEAESDLAEAVERAADVLNTLIVLATGRGMCVSLRVVGGTQSKGTGYYEVGRGLEDCREEGAPQMQLRALAFRISQRVLPRPEEVRVTRDLDLSPATGKS